MKLKNIIVRTFAIFGAIILFQTLYFKFSGHEESVILFTKLGVEPWGRILTGILELFAGIMLIIPKTTLYGAILTLKLMVGAIFSHIFVAGIISNNDGGFLFMLACLELLISLHLIFSHKEKLKSIKSRILINKK